ncbi:hypothetical protein HOM98_06095 [Candidatus Peregrinibacteria bacterium]|jgi:hypothetical protein|nr:hypothetical protein [Candidatus Peregrinibacteria bacterium]MBT7484632.1 hypothetical protein [Candidatus Peregrinibacteria bacterium]
MNNLSKSVLEKIKKAGLRPRPKWQFVAWRVLFWIIFILSVFVGGGAFGMIFHQLFGTEWGFMHKGMISPFYGVMLILPYICWFSVLGVMVAISFKTFSQTKKGYKYRPLLVIGISVFLSFLLGLFVYQMQLSHGMHEQMKGFGPYAKFNQKHDAMWVAPENGVLMGEILEISETSFSLKDMNGENWTIHFTDEDLGVEPGDRAFIMGEESAQSEFVATEIKVRGDRFERKFGPRS